ncbi:MAG: HEPN domain-containing protein [Endomicrobiales bacterium]|nr:HEPN domain-containing protein [Endomicrobiales bacterium]
MPKKVIEKLLNERKLKKQDAGIVQVEKLLTRSMHDLSEAQKILKIAEDAAYLMAYNAMLKSGRALLLLNGFVPDDGAQHKTVVEVTSAILGPKFEKVTSHFEIMRKKRNILTYEADGLVTSTECEKAFEDSIELVRTILNAVKSQNPQLELKFELK